ncbi:hypothetical protein ACP275_14G180600 [Erythranthe tilingii]
MAHKIHVLLVEHDVKDLDKTINMLNYFSYEVTQVNLASAALSILSKSKIKIDLVMMNINSPDSCGFQLLQDATKRNLLVILMSNDDDCETTTRALHQGAFLRIKKPVTMQMAGYLWQHVLREKTRRRLRESTTGYNSQDFRDQEEGNRNNYKNVGGRKTKTNSGNNTSQNDDSDMLNKKVWIEWTEELHYKFVDAVIQLGEGRCYPKEILELMNEPRLTRMQVASHLQKCRKANWLPPGARKSKSTNTESTPPKNKARRSKTERFGSMPFIDNDEFNPRSRKYNHGANIDPSSSEVFNMGRFFGAGEPSTAYGSQNAPPSDLTDDTFEVSDTDSMVQILSEFDQDLEMDYNLNEMTTVTNATSEWSQEEEESVNDEETEG